MDLKLLLKKIFRCIGIELKLYNFLNAEEPLLKKILADYKIEVVIDVGANEGQYAKNIFKNGYKGIVHSFEPISSAFQILEKSALKNELWHVSQMAIGSKEENRVINISQNIVSSSIYEVGEISLAAEPLTKIVRQENVQVTTIDRFFRGDMSLKGAVFLKLDVQGYELEALKGALQSLNMITLLQVELSFVPVYKHAPLFIEIVSFLKKQGFELFTLLPGFKDTKSGRLLQADGIFVKSRLTNY